MSKGSKENQTAEKVMTKYDRKMEKRRLEQEKEAKAKKRSKIITTVVLVCLVALIVGSVAASLIRRNNTFNGTYVKIGEHELTKLEYDFYYNSTVNNYLSTYAYLLSYMGLDTTGNFEDQMYTETMTWKDFFDQMTVEQIRESKALGDDATAQGFVYDVTEDYGNFLTNVDTNLETNGVSKSKYYKEVYGEYANEKRVEGFVKDTLLASAYYDKLVEDNRPSQEEVDTYYGENKDLYDTVTYRSFTFSKEGVTAESGEADKTAALTELATKADEFKNRLAAGEDFNTLCAEYTTDEETKKNYQDAEQDYSLAEKAGYSSANGAYSDWLFDETRKAGDVEVVQDEDSATCYVVLFESRDKDEETVNQTISDTLANQAAGSYVATLTEKYEVTDVAGKLNLEAAAVAEETEEETTTVEETVSTEESTVAAE